ncbi:MAG TPA: hypothetical protein VFA60_12745 [Terriglobales bacterium]|nr:hypothetical protein [Terriglobales bacterium]
MPTATTSRPPVAIEITADAVIAARGSHGAVQAYASRSLPPAAVSPNLTAPNVAGPTALATAVQDALAAIDARTRDLTAVLPDAAVRTMLLDFDTLPDRPAEALPLIRFRLKKLLPFDAERAALSYHAFRVPGAVRVAAAVALASTVEEYESAIRDAGYSPGVVLPSLAAALGAVDPSRPTLLVKSDAATTTVAIVDQGELRLVRTMENTRGHNGVSDQLADDIYPLLVFFQDTYGAPIERILVSGAADANRLRAEIEPYATAKVHELISSSSLAASYTGDSTPRGLLAGVIGALQA